MYMCDGTRGSRFFCVCIYNKENQQNSIVESSHLAFKLFFFFSFGGPIGKFPLSAIVVQIFLFQHLTDIFYDFFFCV